MTLRRRTFRNLPQALREEPGVHVQQTSTSQGSPFIRGLTGQYVVNLVDGVRFNNATFRPGANQYTALIEPLFVEQVEIVRGPASTQYGSDALGGTVNVITASLGTGNPRGPVHGRLSATFGSADQSWDGGGQVGVSGTRWGLTVGAVGRDVGDLRTGGAVDSHSVATRLLGLPSAVLGARLDQTSYTQYSGNARLVVVPSSSDVLTMSYLHGEQQGANRYDQLDGGVGNLIGRFDPQVLDFGLARYERMAVGPLDTVSVTASYNAQRDDRSSQGVNNSKQGLHSKVTDERNRTEAVGVQVLASADARWRQRLTFGGEAYDERVDSTRVERSYSAASDDFSVATDVRARFPNGARYGTAAVFAQDTISVVPDRLLAVLGLRYSRFRYRQTSDGNPVLASGPTVPDFDTTFGDLTWNTGVVWALSPHVSATARAGRGFRAPNVNDFGTIGISGLGFEISPDEGVRVGASAARLGALDSSFPIDRLDAEALQGYELGCRVSGQRVSATASAFYSGISQFIERRAVVMPAGAVGTVLGGQPIIRQGASGEVYTALSSTPVIVRANGGRIRLMGGETALTARMPHSLQITANLSYVHATDLETGEPPDLENGMPPAHGYLGIAWTPPARRWWGEVYTLFALAQHRLSANDRAQPRIGGARTSQEIRDFFANGAVARGLVQDGVLLATGESVDQVIRRVIGADSTAIVPLFTFNPGYAVVSLRGGVRLGRQGTLTLIVENLFDRNYRSMGSGVDGAGLNVVARYSVDF